MTDLEKVQKTLSDVFDYLNRNDDKEICKRLLAEVGDAHRIVENLAIHGVSEIKQMDDDYPLIAMKDIDKEARLIAVRWHENATNWIGDKHKLASDIMNYARRKRANDR
jgi:replicative superfamily II helicase